MKIILSAAILAMSVLLVCVNGVCAEKLSDDEVTALIREALPSKAPAAPKKPRTVLLFTLTRGYRHACIPVGVKALTMLGEQTGAYKVVHSEDIAMFEPESLSKFDAVILFQTIGELFSPPEGRALSAEEKLLWKQREERLKRSFKEYVQNGGGLVGVHAATASFGSWPDFGEMLGAYFSYHPAPKPVWFKNERPDHPVNAAFGGKDFEIKDEIYRYTDHVSQHCIFTKQPYSRDKLRVLLSLDFSKVPADKGDRKDGDCAVSWVKTYGKGRVFYCGLGHFDEIYYKAMVLGHYLAGIQYATGDLEADASPDKVVHPSMSIKDSGEGLVSLFNSKDLTGWDFDKRFWSVKDGAMVAEAKEGTNVQNHSYAIWQGGKLRDFELRMKIRWTKGNSGIDYRADRIEKGRSGEDLKWTIQGYQADITEGWMCSLYNWNKPGAQPGQFVVVEGQTAPRVRTMELADPNLLRKYYFKPGEWNEFVIVARGSHIIERLNGYQTVEFIDNGPQARREGLLGMQVHSGSRGQLFEFKDIRIKKFDEKYAKPVILFNGRDLAGWYQGKGKDSWGVEDGALVSKAGEGMILAAGEYENFVLRFQFRFSGDSRGDAVMRARGIRGDYPRQINIQGKGDDFYAIVQPRLRVEAEDKPVRKLPEGFWNDCEIVANRNKLTVKVNDVVRLSTTEALKGKGRLGFITYKAGAQYRNIVLIPILD